MPSDHQLGTGFLLPAALVCLQSPSTNAAVIENDMALVPGALNPANQDLTLTRSIPPGQGLLEIEVQRIGSTRLRFTSLSVAETYALYPVEQFTTFDPAYAQSHTPLVSNDPRYPQTGDFVFDTLPYAYFAYWDERFGGPAGPDPADNYGWVALQNDGSGLQILSGATAIGGGIVVGTTGQVPEPSPALLAPLGVTAAATLRARRRPIRRAHR
jgi:MYXO-CTERM domain-containing protein